MKTLRSILVGPSRRTLLRTFVTQANPSRSHNVVKSAFRDVTLPNVPLHEFIFKNIHKWQDKTAVVCQQTGRSYKYHELVTKSKAVAKYFRKTLGLRNGDTIAIIMPNTPEYPTVILGASQVGLRVTTVNPNYNVEEMQKQLVQSETKAIVTLSTTWPTVSKVVTYAPKIPIVVVKHENHHPLPEGTVNFSEINDYSDADFEPVDPKQTALLPYSSGTTGLPKGVELTHNSFVANLAQCAIPEIKMHIDAEGDHQDVVPVFIPMFHIYGMSTVTFNMLSGGCKLVTVPKFGTQELLDVLENYKPTVMNIVPPIVNLINKHPSIKAKHLETLRIISSGAAPLGAADVQRFGEKTNNRIPLFQGYGMTEASPVVAFQTAHLEHGVKEGGVGVLLPNTESKVVDPSGKALGPNQTGELLFRGPQIMKGYYKNEAATKQSITEDGFLRSGDIGHYDEDGHFFVTDRSKDLIKVKGFQVAPAELEELLRHHPDVTDAAVVGVPDPKTGEAPKAFVVVKSGSSVTPDAVKGYVASKVSSFKNLSGGVVFVDAIPKNPSGKILRKELKNL